MECVNIAYIQSILIKKIVEKKSFERQRGLETEPNAEEKTKTFFKTASRDEDIFKCLKTKNITRLIPKGGTMSEEPR
ncbi:hypothetical protein CWI38_0541p0010 [Hamiltosporidium tvaerminnensis]|uniref:Uncharacterized protein n=1 Tax=Hamiltosporidium tvaerminnensis TaxID=1176355 RepID=A0A4Q9LZ82_9MICR|nr:hypothetical protein CWI38_0541p0010 [Hamiltosporidium tvaerminnensis]